MHTASSSLRKRWDLLLLLLFCCEKRDFLFVTYNREKKNARLGFCVCVSTYS